MVSKARANRIGVRIQEELSEILLQRVADPRLTNISVTDVKVDKELAYADIFFSAIDGTSRLDEILQGFESARGYLRTELASRINLRSFPRLRFHWDPTFEQAERIEKLISSLQKNNQSEDHTRESTEGGTNLTPNEVEGYEND